MSTVSQVQVALDLDAFVADDYPRVVAAVAAITGDRDHAADAVQDALVGYLADPPRKPVRNVAAWITVVASNRGRDKQRSRQAEKRAMTRLAGAVESRFVAEPEDGTRMLDVDVKAALAALPERQRQVCVLHYLLDQSVETIAEGLAVSSGTVKTLLHRARKTLANRLRTVIDDA